jgi:hypothetical protein
LLDETVEGDHIDQQLLTVVHRLRNVVRQIELARNHLSRMGSGEPNASGI